MCTTGRHTSISRRRFAGLAIVGAGASLLPFRASSAGTTDALCIMCIDYRLVNGAISFFNSHVGAAAQYDLVALAGASLAGVLTKFPDAVPGFWKQIELAKSLHDIRRVVVLDHMQCGAYQQQFNGGKPMDEKAERATHEATMRQVKDAFFSRFAGGMGLEFFLMNVTNDGPGRVDPIAV